MCQHTLALGQMLASKKLSFFIWFFLSESNQKVGLISEQISQNWNLIFLRKTFWAGRSFNTRYRPAQASTLDHAKRFPTICCVCAWESTQLISFRSGECLGVQLASITIPTSQRLTRLMLPDIYEDCLTCHVEIEGAVISFKIRKHNNCRSSRLRLAVLCVVGTDVEHFVSLRCSLSPSSCTSFALKTSRISSKYGNSFVCVRVRAGTFEVVSGASGHRRNIRLAPRICLQPLKRVDKSHFQEKINKVM